MLFGAKVGARSGRKIAFYLGDCVICDMSEGRTFALLAVTFGRDWQAKANGSVQKSGKAQVNARSAHRERKTNWLR